MIPIKLAALICRLTEDHPWCFWPVAYRRIECVYVCSHGAYVRARAHSSCVYYESISLHSGPSVFYAFIKYIYISANTRSVFFKYVFFVFCTRSPRPFAVVKQFGETARGRSGV